VTSIWKISDLWHWVIKNGLCQITDKNDVVTNTINLTKHTEKIIHCSNSRCNLPKLCIDVECCSLLYSNCQNSTMSGNETFLSQVGTFLGDRNLTSLSASNKSSTYCSFLSPSSSYTVDDNGCLISTNINHSVGTYPVGSGTVAAATQRVILMQQPPTAVAQMQINPVESVDSSCVNKQFVVVNTALSTQNNMTATPVEGW